MIDLTPYLPGLHVANTAAQSLVLLKISSAPNPPPDPLLGDHKEDEPEAILVRFGTRTIMTAQMILSGLCGTYLFNHPEVARRFPFNRASLIASVVAFSGGLLRWYAFKTLGKQFTFEIGVKKDARMVKHGIYSWLRHPSYTGMIMFQLGSTINSSLWLHYLCDCGLFSKWWRNAIWSVYAIQSLRMITFLFMRMPREEQMLKRHFGRDYELYTEYTYRLIPFIY